MVRRAIESFYTDRATVTIRQPYIKPNKATGYKEFIVFQNQPCKLSFNYRTQSQLPTNKSDAAYTIEQIVKVFIAPECDIPPGSKITVIRNGKNYDYCQSGMPAIFTNHQEITLDTFQEWA